MITFFHKIFLVGVSNDLDSSETRTIVLSNALALILFFVNVLLLLFIPQNHNIYAFIETSIALVIFSIPFLLNHFKLFIFNRLYLSWVPPILLISYVIIQIRTEDSVPVTLYDGIKMYLITLGCLPYLLYGPKDYLKLLLAIIPGFLILLFSDQIMHFAGVGIDQIGIETDGYQINKTRAVISYFIISGTSLALKFLIERSDQTNKELLQKLAQKNLALREHADKALNDANLRLTKKVQELNEREFFLNQSQKIAKVGSWEYRIRDSEIIWSNEMYNILGLDKTIDLHQIDLNDLLVGEDGEMFTNSTINLLKTGESYDVTVKAKTPLGYVKWLRLFSFPLMEEGKIIGTRGICHDVTYYKEAEELIREREYKYRRLFEQAFDPIFITDLNGNLVDSNSSFCKLLGYNKQELLQKNINDLIEPNQLKERPIMLAELRKGMHIFSERTMIKKDGSIIQVEASVKKYTERQIMSIIRDMTEIRKAQKLIEESEVRFRTAFEYSAIGMAMISPIGQYTKVNEQFCHILGYDEDELVNLTFYDVTHPDDLEENVMLFNESLNGARSTYSLEKRYLHKSGEIVWVRIAVSLVHDTSGIPLYFIVQIENITGRKKAEMELIEAETKFRTLVEKSMAGVYIIQDGKYKYVNQAFSEMLGYTPDELIEKIPNDQLVHPEDRKKVGENIQLRLQKEHESIRYELRGLHKNGNTVWGEAFGSRIPYQGSSAIIGTVIDITQRKQHEKEQALLASIVNSSNDAIISCSLNCKINSWNKGAQQIFGYTSAETIDKDLSAILLKEIPSKSLDFLDIIKTGKALDNFHLKGIRKDGMVIELTLTVSPIIDENGKVIGSSIIGRDETFKVKAEKAIRESEERYRILVENAPEALVVFDVKNQKFVNVSQSAEELFKMTREELLKLGPRGISPEFQPNGEKSDTLAKKWLNKASKEGSAIFDWLHLDALGNEIPCEVRLIRMPSDGKTLIRGSIIDISDRIKKEKELADLNKKIGELKLMALRSVMSPHFIFNALNSIQFYIAKNDRLNAINYLSTFSKLVRSVLNHSVDNTIKLSEEIELLKNYIDLEQIRFENKFEYNFEMDMDSDPDSIEIPSLLIQPYVENAILHGLYNKMDQGHLKIKFTEEVNNLIIEIEDDGIGREAAMKLKQLNTRKPHRSMGIKLTEERLRLISEDKKIAVHIDDLNGKKGNPGTKVTLSIPY